MSTSTARRSSATAGSSTSPERDFDEFYTAHAHSLIGQIYAYVGDLPEAEDLVAEAFCRAYARWRTVGYYENPLAWVRRVAWNLATSHHRRQTVIRRFLRRTRDEHSEGPQPDRLDLRDALRGLRQQHRKAVILYYLAQMTTTEIARQEGVSESTVRSWLSRGRAALQDKLRITEEEV
ncbi:RNA polymerase sigma factor [Salininema proteolyticum]|uniref:RNA polymerase sigma factor n=1 Tax=Salininema proteolyticum TaxID=1607685 RepID=A0ABV8TZ40_9ACTN